MAAGVGRFRLRRKIEKRVVEEDSISSLPDEILQHILCFLPTKFAIRTSLLSKRWKGLWCDTPCISFASCELLAASRNKTQDRYTAQKMMSLHLRTGQIPNFKNISTWIELAMVRRVENVSLELDFRRDYNNYTLPDSFFIQSSLKELSLAFRVASMIPTCSVSWTSLKKLSLRNCALSDASLASILSGCPVLESLTLCFCDDLIVVDLSNSPSLTTLEVQRNFWAVTSMQIVAPHLRCLMLNNSKSLCTLVDVSSLAEAKLNIWDGPLATDDEFLEVALLMMLECVQNVEKLTFGKEFLEVKDLTLDTTLDEYVIPPGIQRLLQKSPDLKKLHISACKAKPGPRRRKSRWGAESKHMDTFMELMFKNTKTLEKMVVRVEDCYLEARGFKEMNQTLSHNNDNNNVSIVVSNIR